MKWITKNLLTLSFCIMALKSSAQFTLVAQLRTRTEFRDGQGTPLPEEAKPAFFTSQRTRITLGYNGYRLKFGLSAQDVRVWGQDVSSINRTTTQDLNGLMLHEAWAELFITDTTVKNKSLSLKIGRQELVYDDQRLLGNLDWLQQGRRHDAALLKYEDKNWIAHLGGAFNQNKESASSTIYNSTPAGNYPANTNGGSMYKSLAFVYIGKKLKNGTTSFLFLTDGFSKYHSDTTNQLKVFENGSWRRATTGVFFTNNFNKILLTASAYYQFGSTATGQNVNAELLNLGVQYAIIKKFSAGAGIDFYSGGTNGSTTKFFDPLYGTPHKFAGLMDYYYAASPFGKNGLVDYFLKFKYKPNGKFSFFADIHQFNSAASINGHSSKDLGQEIDVFGNYALNKQISFDAGYGGYFSTSLLTSPTVKNVPNAQSYSNWAYLSINVRPEFNFK